MTNFPQLKWVLIIFLSLLASNVRCEQKQDSLLRILNSTVQDSTRVNVLNELSGAFRNEDYKKALKYSEEGLKLAEKINFKKGMATSLTNIGMAYYRQHDLEKSREYLDKSFKILEELQDKTGIANYYNSIGDIYLQKRSFDIAIKYYNQSLEIFKTIGNKIGIIRCYNSIGHTFNIREQYAKAMEYYIRSLNIAEKSGDKKGIANCYINVANVLNAQENYKSAIQYLDKSVKIFEASGDKYNIGVCYNNIAANYIDQDSLVQALKFLGKSLQIYKDLGDKKGQSACYTNMGIVSGKNKKHKKAINFFQSALSINESLRDKNRIAASLGNLTISYLELKDYDAVIRTSERGLKIAKEINAISLQRVFYENLSTTYASLQNYKLAYENYKLLKQTDDSLFNAEKHKQVLELEAKYSSEKKEIEISSLTKDNQLQAVQLEKNRNFQFFLVIISILVLILLLVFYRLYALKLNSSKLLAHKNEELEFMNHTLSDSEATLKELNATKDKFFTIIAHDIKNPLSAYRSVTKMLTNSFFELSEQQKLEYIRGIYKSSENLYELFQNLLQWSTSQAGSMKFKPQEIDLGILSFKAVAILQESADKKSLQVDMDVKTDTYAFGDINMVSTVLVNLVSNAIKYSKPTGTINIKASDSGNFLKISVTDNGVGITKEDIEKLFRVEIDHKTIGDSEEKGTGIGLILCKEFVTKNGGTIWVESEYGKGATFNFTLPKIPD